MPNSGAYCEPAIHREVTAMADTVRCPYCALGFEFRPMVAHLDGRYICDKCGHTARPDDRKYQCRCPRCVDLAILRQAAS